MSDDQQQRRREEVARRRRLEEVFGDALPEQTRDDVEPDERPADRDDWFRSQVPPHHGD